MICEVCGEPVKPRNYRRVRYCSRRCCGIAKRGRHLKPADRWRSEDRGYETPCHIWQLHISKRTGYGTVRRVGVTISAHVAAWEAVHGPVPKGMELDHLCRVRACVREDHLEPVAPAINTRRSRVAKLTAEDVAEIRRREGARTNTLAAEFGVVPSTISKIRGGKRWR